MTNAPNSPPGAADQLQFDRAETVPPPPAPGAAQALSYAGVSTCAACNQPITDVYFEANGRVVCPRCRDVVLASQVGGSAVGRLFKATVVGFFAGAVGAAIWYGVRKLSNSEWGIIAVVVGLMVGGAVRYGSGGRGGKAYQFLALFITYISICANYVPDIYWGIAHGENAGDAPKLFIFAFAVVASLAVPFMAGLQNIIGMLIIAFALWEAWRINKRQDVTFNGPYRLAPVAPVPGVPGTPGMPPPFPAPAYSSPAYAAPHAAASAPPPPPPNLGL